MIPRLIRNTSLILALATCSTAAATALTHHEIEVRLDPLSHHIEVVDTILLGRDLAMDADGTYHMVIHAGLAPEGGDAARLRDTLQTRGHIHAVAINVTAVNDDVAEMQADAQL